MHWSNPPRRKNRSRLLAAKRRRAKSEQIRTTRASLGLTDQSRGIPTRRRRSVERCGEEEEGGRAVSLAHVSGEEDPRWRARAEGDLKACSAERAGGRRNRLPLARFALLPSLVTTTMACGAGGSRLCLRREPEERTGHSAGGPRWAWPLGPEDPPNPLTLIVARV